MKIVIDDKIPFIQGAFEAFAEVVYLPGGEINREHLKDADALVTRTRTQCNKHLLEGTTVKFIASATIGFDHIDTAYCERNNIRWTNAPGCNSGSVVQYVSSILAWLELECKHDLSSKTIGIIGAGNVGGKLVELCKNLGIAVLVNDPPLARREGAEGFVSLEELLAKADIISIHTPLNRDGEDKSYHLINEESILKLKPGAVLINSSRGEVVQTSAALMAIDQKLTSYFILDVWENEPAINTDLLAKLDQATPHIAGYSADGKAIGTTMSVHAIARFFNLALTDWKPTNVPEPDVTTLNLDCSNLSVVEAFAYAVKFTYDINHDTNRLKTAPEKFEYFRGSYPIRREFGSFTLKLSNASSETKQILSNIGFNVQ